MQLKGKSLMQKYRKTMHTFFIMLIFYELCEDFAHFFLHHQDEERNQVINSDLGICNIIHGACTKTSLNVSLL